jgi:glutamate racemase
VLIDTGAAVAKELKRRSEEAGLLNGSDQLGNVIFWSNSIEPNAEEIMMRLWGKQADFAAIN